MGRVTDTVSGSLATFRTPYKQVIRSLKAYFTPVQEGEGTPSPDNVRPISGWTGCEVYRTKQNMIDLSVPYQNPSDTALVNTTIRVFKPYTYSYGASYSNWWQPHQIVSCSIEGDKLRVVTKDTSYGVGFAIPVKAGWVMRLSYNSTGRTHIAYYDRWGKYITGGPTNTINLTVPNQAAIGLIIFESYPSGAEVVFSDIMLTVQTAVPYEPYQGTTLPIDWSSAGTVYGGYVDLVTGEVWKQYERTVLDGSYNPGLFPWRTNTDAETGEEIVSALYLKRDTGDNRHYRFQQAYADSLPFYLNTVINKQGVSMYDGDSYSIALTLPVTTIGTTKETLNAYLAKHPVTVVFEMQTPELVTTLTPTALRTLIGTNNIWADCGNVSVEYDFAESREMTEARKRVMAFDAANRLPAEYRKVEYIQNPEATTAHINTGIIVTEEQKF